MGPALEILIQEIVFTFVSLLFERSVFQILKNYPGLLQTTLYYAETMLAIACSRITIRNCPEGTSGKAARDIKPLTVGPVILVVLMKNAKMCPPEIIFADSEDVKKNIRLVAFYVTES